MTGLSLEPMIEGPRTAAAPGAKPAEALLRKPLVIELGCEELPVQALPALAAAFAAGITAALDARGVARGNSRCLYTPRRLAVQIDAVATQQVEQKTELFGPYVPVALDAQGQPTAALKGFAAKQGVDWTALERASDAKGERFVHRAVKPGAPLAKLLPELVATVVDELPVAKPMRWGAHEHFFARPLLWVLMLHGERVIDGSVLEVKSDRMSRGHRFHYTKPLWISRADEYIEALRVAHVLVDPNERRSSIRVQVEVAAREVGGIARITESNLEQVNCLVEWPQAITCSFDRAFLRVPQEALISTMEANQRFFAVVDDKGQLTERFIAIANLESHQPDEVRKGFERVIRPRFADAAFFFDEDVKQGLAEMNAGLAQVSYQAKLGSYADKVARVVVLAARVAMAAGADVALARQAAGLCRADLQSRLVGEFPELQGIAGRYYALAAGEPEAVALALDEVYAPRFSGDAIAKSPLGRVLAIAERIDAVVGGFAAGLKPSGNKDPFGLRRAALGLARSLIEGGIELDLPGTFRVAATLLPRGVAPPDADTLFDFVLERLRSYYSEAGVQTLQFDAVAAVRPHSLRDFDQRVRAIREFSLLREANALAAANKRIRNILRKIEGDIDEAIDPARLEDGAERELLAAVDSALADTTPALAEKNYVAVLQRLAKLALPVDRFFDTVMVMADDPGLRSNRLALLKRLSERFLAVADVSRLTTEVSVMASTGAG